MQAPPRGPRISTRKAVACALALAVLVVSLDVAATLEIRQVHDRRQFVESVRLAGALQTFRPSERAGLAKPVDAADLARDRSVRTEPAGCTPLTLLSTSTALDAESWTGINGSPAQPVTILTVRYADAATARADLRAKRMAIFRCHTIQLSFPPFDAAPRSFTVHPRHRLLTAMGDRVNYRLDGPKQSYDFYVRQYANTLSWSYGDDVSTPEVRQQMVDDLIDRLRELDRR